MKNQDDVLRENRCEYYRKWREKRFKDTPCKSCGKKMRGYGQDCFSCCKIGGKNPAWKGDTVGYQALHKWVRKWKPRTELCERCKKVPPFDLANVSNEKG